MATTKAKAAVARRQEAEVAGVKLGTFKVLGNLQHDGVDYTPGDGEGGTIELDDETAAPLLAVRVIQPIEAA